MAIENRSARSREFSSSSMKIADGQLSYSRTYAGALELHFKEHVEIRRVAEGFVQRFLVTAQKNAHMLACRHMKKLTY